MNTKRSLKKPKAKKTHNARISIRSLAGHPLFRSGACILLLVLTAGCGSEAPAGITRANLEGVWSGAFNQVTLMGRTLSGEIDWQFSNKTFEIRFFDPPPNQSQRIGGDWEFAGGRLALTLRTSFPIENDVGTTDTLFIAISGGELSMKTSTGSDILLLKTQGALRIDTHPYTGAFLARAFRRARPSIDCPKKSPGGRTI